MTNKPLDPKDLGSLYPTPKSYDEKRAEREALNQLHEQQRPTHPVAKIGGSMCVIIIAIYLATFIVPTLIMGGLAGVSLSFAIGLLILGLAKAVTMTVTDILERYGWYAPAFYIGYAVGMAVIFAATFGVPALPLFAKVIILVIANFAITFALIRYLSR